MGWGREVDAELGVGWGEVEPAVGGTTSSGTAVLAVGFTAGRVISGLSGAGWAGARRGAGFMV